MKVLLLILVLAIRLTVNGQTYYIVRHAEKAQLSSGSSMYTTDNPPLSKEGSDRAMALKDFLKDKKVRFIFSTNTLRTLSTAAPLGEAIHTKIRIYSKPDLAFIDSLRALKHNTLIVAHSNTADDIVNALTKAEYIKADLPDYQFDNLYVVRIKGKKISFEALKYGKPSD